MPRFGALAIALGLAFSMIFTMPLAVFGQEADFIGTSTREEEPVESDVEQVEETEPPVDSEGEEDGESVVPVDSPLKGLEDFLDQLMLFLMFKPASKAEKYVQMAEERLAKIRSLVETGKEAEEAIEEHVLKFEEHMKNALKWAEEAREREEEVGETLDKIGGAIDEYKGIAEDFYETIPEPVKESIEEGAAWIQQKYQEILDRIPEEKKNQVLQGWEWLKERWREFVDGLNERFGSGS